MVKTKRGTMLATLAFSEGGNYCRYLLHALKTFTERVGRLLEEEQDLTDLAWQIQQRNF